METQDGEDNLWNFSLAQRFSRAFKSSSSDLPLDDESIPRVSDYNPKAEGSAPKSLGDFDRLFTFCGKPIPIKTRRVSDSTLGADNSSDDKTTPPSSVPDEAPHFKDYVNKVKGVRWTDEEGTADLARYRTRSVRGSLTALDATAISQFFDAETDSSDLESDSEDDEPVSPTTLKNPKISRSSKARKLKKTLSEKSEKDLAAKPSSLRANVSHFIPASVAPIIPPSVSLLHTYKDNSSIHPIHTLTVDEQKAKLVKKLAKKCKQEAILLRKPETILQKGGNMSSTGIHVFVDLSNIVIGWTDEIKLNRFKSGLMTQGQYVRHDYFSFHSLAIILERGRQVARRVMVGSTGPKNSDSSTAHYPKHIRDAEQLQYEPNILERVPKLQRLIPIKKKGGAGSGYATASGYSSASETQMQGRIKMQEQAVDELLQMKMLESIVDYQTPSTIVLASGDAAEAEYSGGFLQTVERALKKGWKVEVVGWSKGLSNEYRSSELLKKWEGNLSVLELDDFCEEMLGIYATKW